MGVFMLSKILLVNPNWGTSMPEQPPFGVIALAAYVRKFGHDVRICERPLGEDIVQMIDIYKPDVVGVTISSCSTREGYGISKLAMSKGIYTVIGGVHPSSEPDEALNFADAVVIGEGEVVFEELVESRAKGIFTGKPVENLDDLPFPAFDLLTNEWYVTIRKRIQNSIITYCGINDRIGMLITAKGCNNKPGCKYCYNSSPYMTSVMARQQSAERVLQDFHKIVEDYRLNTIQFLDDNFLFNRQRLEKICAGLEGSGIYWSAYTRVSDVNQDIMELLKKSGCVQLAFGFESHNDRILQDMRKNTTTEQQKEAVRLCHANDLIISGNFMMGFPNETMEEMINTFEFMRESNIDGGMGLARALPFPSTKLWDWCVENKKIDGKLDWTNINYSSYPVNMSAVDTNIFQMFMDQKIAPFQNVNIKNMEPLRLEKLRKCKERIGAK